MRAERLKARALWEDAVSNSRVAVVTSARTRLAEIQRRVQKQLPNLSGIVGREIESALSERLNAIEDVTRGAYTTSIARFISSMATGKLESENPAALYTLRKLAEQDQRLSATLTELQLEHPVSNFILYDEETVDVTMSAAGIPSKGLRLAFVDETNRENERILLIDEDAWPLTSYVARLEPAGERYYPNVVDVGIALDTPTGHPSSLAVERELDEKLRVKFSARRKRAYWLETGLVEDLAQTLQDGDKPTEFHYFVDDLWVYATLHIFPQRGKPERRLGDLTLIVDRMTDTGVVRGVGAVEAKIRHFDDGKLHALDETQAANIIANEPKAVLAIFDRHAGIPWHVGAMPLLHYSKLKAGDTSDILAETGVPFSQQVFRGFFRGIDLDEDPQKVADGMKRLTYFTGYVASGEDPKRELARLKMLKALDLQKKLRLELDGPKLSRSHSRGHSR